MEKIGNYDDLMTRLRSVEPLLDGEDELAAGVMGKIARLGAVKALRRRALIAGCSSAAAALFLTATMSIEIFSTSPVTLNSGHEYAKTFKNRSKSEVMKIVSERMKKECERELVINNYSKKLQSHEN
jgi:hypothetical protein